RAILYFIPFMIIFCIFMQWYDSVSYGSQLVDSLAQKKDVILSALSFGKNKVQHIISDYMLYVDMSMKEIPTIPPIDICTLDEVSFTMKDYFTSSLNWGYDKVINSIPTIAVDNPVSDTIVSMGKYVTSYFVAVQKEDVSFANFLSDTMDASFVTQPFKYTQTLSIMLERSKHAIPLYCMYNVVHTWTVYNRKKQMNVVQDSLIMQLSQLTTCQKNLWIAYGAAFLILPPIRNAALYMGQAAIFTTLAGGSSIGIGGALAISLLGNRIANRVRVSQDPKVQELIQNLKKSDQEYHDTLSLISNFEHKTAASF